MSEELASVYRALNDEERDALLSGLALAAEMAKAQPPLSMVQVQALYDGAIAARLEDNDQLIAIGLAFGHQIVARTGWDWVRLSDEWGEETVVGPYGKKINCAPISMIKKRIQRQEASELEWLASTIIERLDTILAEKDQDAW